jgi:hypothetical protein
MVIKDKILKKIADKEKQLKNMKEVQVQMKKKQDELFDEDMKFIHAINPFYKRKWTPSSDVMSLVVTTMLESQLEHEIEELKKLIR